MSFSTLYHHNKNALAKLSKLKFVAENCRRSVAGEQLLVDRGMSLPDPAYTVVSFIIARDSYKHCSLTNEFFISATLIRRRIGKLLPPFRPYPRLPSSNAYERMFDHGTRENDLLRILLTFVICETIGLLFFITVAIKYATFPSRLGVYVGVFVQFVMGLMIAFPTMRAIVLIAVPSLATKKLRTILLLFILSWSFQIPAMNTTKNLQLLAESVGCVRDTVVTNANRAVEETNQQSSKFSLDGFKSHMRYFTKHLFAFRKVLRNLQSMVAGFGRQAKDYLKQLLRIKERCQRFFVGPYYFCLHIFEDAANRCERLSWKLTRFDIRCQLINKLRFVCEVARFTEQVCVLPTRIKQGLKQGYLSFVSDQTRNDISAILDAINVRFYLVRKLLKLESLREKVEYYSQFVKYLTWIINCIIGPIVLLPFIVATIYVIKYNRHEEVDNYYITEHIRNIDILREAQGQPTILPLMPKEKQNYIEGCTLRMAGKERPKMIIAFVCTIIGGFLPVILISLDIFIYHTIYYSYEFFRSNLTRTDHVDHYVMQVSGEGFAASFLKRILEIFNPIASGRAKTYDNWRMCFDEPTPPDYSLFQVMFLLYAICVVLCIAEVYANRLRRLVAAHYWPKRSKPRALYLYNEILEGRKNVLSQTIKAAKKRELKEQIANDELAGRGHILNRGLPILGADQYQCVRCGRPDMSVTDASNSRICPNCNSLYCTDCYTVRKKCVLCAASLQLIMKDVELYCDSSCEEDDYIASEAKFNDGEVKI